MKAVRHFGVVVTDLEKSLHFYRDLLGLTIKRDMLEHGEFIDAISGMRNIKVRTVKMAADNGDTLVELLCYASHPRKARKNNELPNIGASHVAFTVENVDEEYKKLQEAGVRFNCPPQISVDGKAKVTFCYDPDGVPVELVQELPKKP